MKSRTMLLTACAAAMTMTAGVAWAQDTVSTDTVIMLRHIENLEKPMSPPPAGGGDQTLSGSTFGWYSTCNGTNQNLLCVEYPEGTSDLAVVDNSSCMVAQNALHTANLVTRTKALFGANILDPAGSPPPNECGTGANLSYGYLCSGGYFFCAEVDRKTLSANEVDSSKCSTPTKPGFEDALARNGLMPTGPDVDPRTQCLVPGETPDAEPGGPVLGRTEKCVFADSGQGYYSSSISQSCFAVDRQTLEAQSVPMSSCASSTEGSNSSKAIRSQAGLLSPNAAPTLDCGEGDTGVLKWKVISDERTVFVVNGVNYNQREILYDFSCTQDGASVPYNTHCRNAMFAWNGEAYEMAKGAGPNGSNQWVALGGARAPEGVWQVVLGDVYY